MNKQRFGFWRVFWVVLAVYVFFILLGIIASSVAPIGSKQYDPKNFLTWRSVVTQIFCTVYMSFFYYFAMNAYYRLIAQKKQLSEYIKISVFAVLALVVYFVCYYFLSDKTQEKEFPVGLLVFSFSVSSFFQLGLALLIPYLT